MLEKHKDNLWFYLTFLRIFPGSPNWVMNVTFPHIGISGLMIASSTFIGLMPWNYITVEGGNMIATIKGKEDIVKPETYMKLIVIALFFLIPPIVKMTCMKEKVK